MEVRLVDQRGQSIEQEIAGLSVVRDNLQELELSFEDVTKLGFSACGEDAQASPGVLSWARTFEEPGGLPEINRWCQPPEYVNNGHPPWPGCARIPP